ncbi:MAG: glycosyltransferase family 2 protein [Candidatus Shapirobacteria bacterium]|jgi:glycosyltransferase involved in cell wall biosynthesis
MKISVIVPCYNDGKYINHVIDQLRKSKFVGEIIVVDDDSGQETKNLLQKIKGINLITNTRNIGKSKTLKKGVLASKFDYVAFIDSDLTGFTSRHFESLVKPVLENVCDITTSVRGKEAWYGILSGFSIAYTGERAMKRELMTKNIDLFNNHGYIIEAEFNRRFLGKTRMKGILWSEVGQHGQPEKNGLRGWLVNGRQVTSYLKYLGPFEMLRQLVLVKLPSYVLN